MGELEINDMSYMTLPPGITAGYIKSDNNCAFTMSNTLTNTATIIQSLQIASSSKDRIFSKY